MSVANISANPFLTQMFQRITFRAWRNLAAQKAKREELGAEVYDKQLRDYTEAGLEKVVYEKPPVYVEYTSEEEIDSQIENEAFAEVDSNQIEQQEDIVNDRKEKDPYEHRRKVKHQKLRA